MILKDTILVEFLAVFNESQHLKGRSRECVRLSVSLFQSEGRKRKRTLFGINVYEGSDSQRLRIFLVYLNCVFFFIKYISKHLKAKMPSEADVAPTVGWDRW